MDIWNQPPIFINDEGTKWWDDEDTTQYARKKTQSGKSLPDAIAYLIETKDGYRSRVVVYQGQIVAEDQTLDGIGSKIDILKFLEEKPEKSRLVEERFTETKDTVSLTTKNGTITWRRPK